jgi:glycerol-3-phosphate dehydrogenase (NAD(P)+)
MSDTIRTVAVLGDGAWGTAFSLVLLEAGAASIRMWGHDPAYLREMARGRENRLFLPGSRLPEEISFEPDLAACVAGADLAVLAVPTRFLRESLSPAAGALRDGPPLLSLTKGLENGTCRRPSELAREILGAGRVAVLSGPSHAEEVAKRRPTTVVAASDDPDLARAVQRAAMTPRFRVYTSPDALGVELGGALKNVIAVAAGICIGLGLGDNAMAALLTRGLAEITRLGSALGATPETFAGLSGFGDLVTTCVSPYGRNRAVGIEIGKGRSLGQVLRGMPGVAEGVNTVEGARDLARREGVEMPIVEEVYRILVEGKNPREAVEDLMTREAKPEKPLPG